MDGESDRCLFTFGMRVLGKSTEFSVGENLLLITTDPFMRAPSQIHVKRIAEHMLNWRLDTTSLRTQVETSRLTPLHASRRYRLGDFSWRNWAQCGKHYQLELFTET
jgi:hypothetical protein